MFPFEQERGRSVLLVDCFADDAQAYARYLRDHGYGVVAECEGPSAFDIAASARPDIIVIDVTLHNATGIEFIRQLRADARTQDCLVLVLSGHVEDRMAAEPAGADSFLGRPCSPEELAAEIRRSGVRRRQ